jgi:hypothetical protein
MLADVRHQDLDGRFSVTVAQGRPMPTMMEIPLYNIEQRVKRQSQKKQQKYRVALAAVNRQQRAAKSFLGHGQCAHEMH